MTRLRVAQPIETIHGGGTSLACAPDGSITADALHGLFAGDTRMLSTFRITLGGVPLQLLSHARDGHGTATWHFQNQRCRAADGTVPAGAIFVSLRRRVSGAMHDDLRLTSFLPGRLRTTLDLHIDADFADVFEVKAQHLPPRLDVRRSVCNSTVRLEYRRRNFRRATTISFAASSGHPVVVGPRAVFDVELAHDQPWTCCIATDLEIGERAIGFGGDPHDREARAAPRVSIACHDVLARPFSRACADLDSLTADDGHGPYVVAGVPWFATLFGRDTLVTSLMTGVLGTSTARGTLRTLAAWQATAIDDRRDAEPGKLPHELRRGELAHFRAIPHTPYYGTHDAQALYCLTLWNTWRWTGDRRLLDDHLESACSALTWCDRFGDLDGDGLQEYRRRHVDGYYNQSWKDAHDAIVDDRGELGELPLATVELQGYLYAARLAMAELLEEVGEPAAADRQRLEAATLAELVERRFFVSEQRYYALALDGAKRPLTSVSSNPAHLLWCGLPNRARAVDIAHRLLQPDLFTGWGLRTLSAEHRAYNPLSYQLGSVWPHDTAIAAAGLARYGLHDAAAQLIHAVLDAGGAFDDDRLPELFAGFPRTDAPPVPYAQANVPQAWAAAAPVLAVQTLLGIVPDAPRQRCFLAPWLPTWLPELHVTGVPVGESTLDVHLTRAENGDIALRTSTTGPLTAERAPSPAALWGDPIQPVRHDAV